MRTTTTQFEFTHGHKPRGFGQWGFELHFTDGNGRFSTETKFATGTLAEARRQAWNALKSEVGGAKHLLEVTVLP